MKKLILIPAILLGLFCNSQEKPKKTLKDSAIEMKRLSEQLRKKYDKTYCAKKDSISLAKKKSQPTNNSQARLGK